MVTKYQYEVPNFLWNVMIYHYSSNEIIHEESDMHNWHHFA